jgi:ribonucleoside-diphosphate reductase alpha chain
MSLTENALKVLEKRYFLKDENGNTIEDVVGMFRRVAKAIAKADEDNYQPDEVKEIEDMFFNVMMNLDFLPNSPTLMNAGKDMCLSACHVLPIDDSMEGIFETIKNAALIHKSGGKLLNCHPY